MSDADRLAITGFIVFGIGAAIVIAAAAAGVFQRQAKVRMRLTDDEVRRRFPSVAERRGWGEGRGARR